MMPQRSLRVVGKSLLLPNGLSDLKKIYHQQTENVMRLQSELRALTEKLRVEVGTLVVIGDMIAEVSEDGQRTE